MTDTDYPHHYLRDPLHLADAYEQIGSALATMAAGRATWAANPPTTADLATIVTALCDVVVQTTDEARVRVEPDHPAANTQRSIGMLARAATHAATALKKLTAELHAPISHARYRTHPIPQYRATADRIAHILWLHLTDAADSMTKGANGLHAEYHQIGYSYPHPVEQVRGLTPVPLTTSPAPKPQVLPGRRPRRAATHTVAREIPAATTAQARRR